MYDSCDHRVNIEPITNLTSDSSRSNLLFALGNILDRQEDYEGAFNAYHEANKLKNIAFSKEIFDQSLDRLMVGEYTLALTPLESMILCYVFKGPAFSFRIQPAVGALNIIPGDENLN